MRKYMEIGGLSLLSGTSIWGLTAWMLWFTIMAPAHTWAATKIRVTKTGQSLVIRGDAGVNRATLAIDSTGTLTIVCGPGTSCVGQTGPHQLTRTSRIFILMHGGSDALDFRFVGFPQLPDNFSIEDLRIRMGSGHDRVDFFREGPGKVPLGIEITRLFNIEMDRGNDRVSIENLEFIVRGSRGGWIDGGPDLDEIVFKNATFQRLKSWYKFQRWEHIGSSG